MVVVEGKTPTTQDGLGADPSSSRGEPWLINQPRVGQTASSFCSIQSNCFSLILPLAVFGKVISRFDQS